MPNLIPFRNDEADTPLTKIDGVILLGLRRKSVITIDTGGLTMEKRDQEKVFAQIIAKTWLDKSFKTAFLADPEKIMMEHGIEMANIVIPEMSEPMVDINFEEAGVQFITCINDPETGSMETPSWPWEIGA